MTEAPSETTEISAQAADWVQRRHFWTWSDADQAALDVWLAQSMAHRVAFWRFNATVLRTERVIALRASVPEQMPFWRRRGWNMTLRAVAALIVAVSIGAVAQTFIVKPTARVFATTVGGREVIRLNDGSTIELNTDTVLKISPGGSARDVILEKGEAYFQIKHDAARPFVVTLGEHKVVDLGTRFLIRKEKDQLQVSLLEGRARFDAPMSKDTPSIDMRPGDVVSVKNGSVSVSRKADAVLSSQLSWRNGVIVFDSTQLSAAAAEFNRYGGKTLVIADGAAGLKIEGTFQLNNVEAFADAVHVAFGLRVEERANEIRISR